MDRPLLRVRRPGAWLALVAVVAASAAVWLFPRAVPTLALGQRLSRQAALQRADSFFQAHELAPDGARTTVRFRADDSLETYLDLTGGTDTVNAALQGKDVALFTWSVRAFLPRDPHEARVSFATDGRVVGFRRVLAEADPRPDPGEAAAQALAHDVLTSWLGLDATRWRLATTSYETQQASGRVDRTYTYERTDRKIIDAPIRLDIVVAGDLPSAARPYVVVPESFQRRYDEMRSANDLIAIIAQLGMLVILILGAVFLRKYAVSGTVRWGPAMGLGSVIGALAFAAQMNQLPGSWFFYDTATSPGTYQAMFFIQALFSGVGLALLVGLTVAAAEAAARHAFPDHVDWWKAWRHRGTREVAGRVTSGYVVALIGFAYVGLFYLVTRNGLGWWVPSELLDDPNLISTPMPWLSGVALALQAGVWEEALFRALPLSLLAIWARNRPHRMRWLAAGVVGTALVFGFAHANYPSWPPYSRGVEIFLDACFWAVLFMWLGLLVTVVAHFAYDLVLFGLFAASGTGIEYRITAALTLLALLAPVLAVAWRWARQRRLEALPDEGRFGAWTPPPRERPLETAAPVRSRPLTAAARVTAVVVGGAALLLALFLPGGSHLGPGFTAPRGRVVAVADSMARAHDVDPGAWRRLVGTGSSSLNGWRRFLVQEDARELADSMARTYNPAAWWVVRYVRTTGTAADRAEEWRVRIWPDGKPLDVHHLVPDSAQGDSLSADQARRAAHDAIVSAGLDTLPLREKDLQATERPARRDVTLTYTDTTVHLPGDATAQVQVTLAGDEPLVVRRGIELPEAFRRADRERQSSRLIVALICGLFFTAVAATSVVLAIRRRAPVLDDDLLDRRRSVILVGVISLTGLATALNSFPERMFAYSTAMPWSNWVGVNVVISLLAVVPALAAWGLWLATGALRRRVGVSLLPPASGEGRRDALLAGLGLGAVLTLVRLGLSLAEHGGIPGDPSTTLNEAVPLLGTVLSLPLQVVLTVTLLAIPALAIAGVSRRTVLRATVAGLVLAPLVVLAVTLAPPGTGAVARGLALAVLVVAAGWVSVRLWAPYCAWAWILAALVDTGLMAARAAAGATTGVERGAGALALIAAGALLVLAWRRPPTPLSSSSEPSSP
ncbi:MAG: type II CAAX endopeptidase family protein [Gemmatimonadota bacterium]|jgi:hypothetical protein